MAATRDQTEVSSQLQALEAEGHGAGVWFTQGYWGTAVGRKASWGGKCVVEGRHQAMQLNCRTLSARRRCLCQRLGYQPPRSPEGDTEAGSLLQLPHPQPWAGAQLQRATLPQSSSAGLGACVGG